MRIVAPMVVLFLLILAPLAHRAATGGPRGPGPAATASVPEDDRTGRFLLLGMLLAAGGGCLAFAAYYVRAGDDPAPARRVVQARSRKAAGRRRRDREDDLVRLAP